jgi:hypothetical protein
MLPYISDVPLSFIISRYFSSVGDSARISDGRICEVSSIPDRLRKPLACHQHPKINGSIQCSWS